MILWLFFLYSIKPLCRSSYAAESYFIGGSCLAILAIHIKCSKCPPRILLKEFGEENDVNQIVVRRSNKKASLILFSLEVGAGCTVFYKVEDMLK